MAGDKTDKQKQKIEAAINLLIERGMWRSHAYPFGFKFLRWVGIALPPPAFCTFAQLAMGTGLFFGVFWGLIMYLSAYTPAFALLVSAPLSGLLFGISMATFYRWRARVYDLPRWEDI